MSRQNVFFFFLKKHPRLYGPPLTSGTFVEAKNKAGRTALMQACKHGELAAAHALVEAGADPAATAKVSMFLHPSQSFCLLS